MRLTYANVKADFRAAGIGCLHGAKQGKGYFLILNNERYNFANLKDAQSWLESNKG